MTRTNKLPQWKLDLLVEIKAHAIANYEAGWDVVVECFDDEEILAIVGSSYTIKSWIKRIEEVIGARQEAISNCF